MARYEPKKILVPIDLSNVSWGVVRAAMEIGKKWDAEVVVLHVGQKSEHVPRPCAASAVRAKNGSAPYVPTRSQFLEGSRLRMESQIRLMVRDISSGPRFRAEVVWGEPLDRILQAAEEGGYDLIIMATHGLAGLDHFMLGSVAEQVIRRAPCPVLTIRSKVAEERLSEAG